MTWRADYAKEAYSDGKAALREGVEANPHTMGGFEYAAWDRGYAAAQDLEALLQVTRTLEGAA